MKVYIQVYTIIFLLFLLNSCSMFISSEESPESASHGFVEGVTPRATEFHSERNYSTIQANWPGPGGDKIWLGKNLGAIDTPSNSIDGSAANSGWYFQFNRKQGFYHNGEHFVADAAPENNINEDSNWQISNDPCNLLLGSKWRLPTKAEVLAFLQAPVSEGGMGEGNRTSAFNSSLRLHAAGELHPGGLTLTNRGVNGRYWSRDQFSETRGEALHFTTNGSTTNASTKTYARTVRCIFD